MRTQLGAAIKRARQRRQWSLKEFAALIKRDERQVARWEEGSEGALWERLLEIHTLRPELLVALAEIGGDAIEIETTVRIRRHA